MTVTVTGAAARRSRVYTIEAVRAGTDLCARTPAVRDAVVAAVSGASECAAVTSTQLAAVTGLDVSGERVAGLRAGDFAGLGALTALDLSDNALKTLPPGLFAGLAALTGLDLSGNALVALPAGLIDAVTGLTALDLSDNALAALPDNIFEPLGELVTLELSGNPGIADFYPDLVPDPQSSAPPGSLVTMTVRGLSGPWGSNVTYGWEQVADTLGNALAPGSPAVMLSGAGTRSASFTAPTTPPSLYFKVTVTGRGGTESDPAFYRHSDFLTITVAQGPALTSLTVTAGGADVALTPAFSASRLEYTATVGSGVAEATLTAQATGLSVAWLDENDAPLDDAAADFQVDLSPGENTVKVRVTSGSGANAMTRTYTLALIRAPPLALTGLSLTGDDGLPIVLTAVPTESRAYTALVDRAATMATVAAAASAPATLAVMPADAAPTVAGHQVWLHRGVTTIAVTVSYGEVRETSTVRVTRRTTDVCTRSVAVSEAIVAKAGVTDCNAVTPAHLAGIGELDLDGASTTAWEPEAGDLAGLTGMTAFSAVNHKGLWTLPAGLFDDLTLLTELNLSNNGLTALPDNLFETLPALGRLSLEGNPETFAPAVRAGPARTVAGGARVALSPSARGPWGANVDWFWEQVDGKGRALSPPTAALDDAHARSASFATPPEGGRFTFRATAIGRGAGDADGANRFRGSDTVTVTASDRVAPALASATAEGSSVTLVFSEALAEGPPPSAGAFAVTVADEARPLTEPTPVSLIGPVPVSVGGTEVTLRLAEAVTAGSAVTVTVAYTAPGAARAPALQDAAGNRVASFTGRVAHNTTDDMTPPKLRAHLMPPSDPPWVKGHTLTLVYNDVLDPRSVPPASAFTVTVQGVEANEAAPAALATLRPVSVAGMEVTLRLARETAMGERVKVSYRPSDAGTTPLKNVAGLQAADFRNEEVDNRNGAAPPTKPLGFIVDPGDRRDGRVDLRWDEPEWNGGSDITSYRIHYSRGRTVTRGAVRINVMITEPRGPVEHRVEDLEPGRHYAFEVQAVNGAGVGRAARHTLRLASDDMTGPRVTSIERQRPSSSPTAADSLTWRVTFNEAVEDADPPVPAPDASDFAVTGTTAGLTVTAVTGSGTDHQYDVTATGGDLADINGTVTLSLAPGQNITDFLGNRLTNTRVTGTDESSFRVDNAGPALYGATVNGTALHLNYREALDTASVPAASAFTVKVGTATRSLATTDPVKVVRSGVTLTLSSAVTAEQTSVTVEYRVPTATNAKKIQDAAGNDAAALPATTRATNITPRNATGKPRIVGGRSVGSDLYAKLDVDAITDPQDIYTYPSTRGTQAGQLDCSRSNCAFQWTWEDGTDIPEATGRTYRTTEADIGRQVKVRLRFDDQGGHRETRTSDAFPGGDRRIVARIRNLAVKDVEISGPGADEMWTAGETVDVTVVLFEPVRLVDGYGLIRVIPENSDSLCMARTRDPTLASPNQTQLTANIAVIHAGDGTDRLVFRCTVEGPASSRMTVWNQITLALEGNRRVLWYRPQDYTRESARHGRAGPSITDVTINAPASGGAWSVGDTVEVRYVFSGPVEVGGRTDVAVRQANATGAGKALAVPFARIENGNTVVFARRLEDLSRYRNWLSTSTAFEVGANAIRLHKGFHRRGHRRGRIGRAREPLPPGLPRHRRAGRALRLARQRTLVRNHDRGAAFRGRQVRLPTSTRRQLRERSGAAEIQVRRV